MSTKEQFLAEIEAFLRRHDMTASRFGMLCRGNKMVVFRLRLGVVPSSDTIDSIRAWMTAFEARPTKPKRRTPEPRAAA